ncbi:conserved hypothetical protein [gamma proteobacterium HTCC5015]|nr:conserved hypothetical protein [gamma proteobacterium HTCC5015]
MKIKMKLLGLGTLTAAALLPLQVHASPSLAGGVWFNYGYDDREVKDNEDLGDIGGEALILYADHQVEDKPWSVSAEFRMGPGSFTDPANNSTGDQTVLHKGWIGYQFDEQSSLKIGKSQVPFGWKTVNFWPGDHLLGGYADQMDVGFKYSRTGDGVSYDFAYYHADDWGATSTDTVDDNGHWGSSATYRKVQTVVGNVDWHLSDATTLGLSVQSGGLQDLTGGTANQEISGDHQAFNLHYYGDFGNVYTKAQFLSTERTDLPAAGTQADPLALTESETTRAALLVGYKANDWNYYLEVVQAEETNTKVDATAYVPGARYSYGPGWIYLEYLSQDGYIGRDGEVIDTDPNDGSKYTFDAFYASIDYYF